MTAAAGADATRVAHGARDVKEGAALACSEPGGGDVDAECSRAETVVAVMKALADENRLRIIQAITVRDEIVARDMLEVLNVTQPTLSHHMKVLLGCGLVSARKDGKWVHYSLNRDLLGAMGDLLRAMSDNRTRDALDAADRLHAAVALPAAPARARLASASATDAGDDEDDDAVAAGVSEAGA